MSNDDAALRALRDRRPSVDVVPTSDGARLVQTGVPTCDFCGSTPATTAFAASDATFQVPGLPSNRSSGAWAACAICESLIEAEDRERLAHHAVSVMRRRRRYRTVPARTLVPLVRSLHATFWENRIATPDAHE